MSSAGNPRLLRHAPYFPVPSVAAAVAEYERTLGFTVEYLGGSPPEFAIVARDGHAIMFRQVAEKPLVPNEAQGGTCDVFFWVDDARRLHAELASRGAVAVYGPRNTEYRTIEFAVRDQNGYVLGFGEERK